MPLDFVFSPPDQTALHRVEARRADLGARAGNLPLWVRRERYERGDTTGLHLHADFYALYLVKSGRGAHVIDEQPYAMTRGDAYIMPPGATHAYRDYHNLVVDAFYFGLELFSDDEQTALRAMSGFRALFVTSANEVPAEHRLHLTPERHAQAETLVSELRGEIAALRADQRAFENASLENALLARGLFFRLLVWLSRWKSEEGHSAHSPSGALADMLRVCEERFAEPLSVPQLAAMMFVSTGHFSELFAREVGMPPAAYLRRLRLERARTLLRDTSLPV